MTGNPWLPVCTNCGEKASREDDIYCPVSYRSCGDPECDVAVALQMWQDSSKKVEHE